MKFSVYKPGQGRYARATMGALLVLFVVYGCSALAGTLRDVGTVVKLGSQQFTFGQIIPAVVFLLGAAGVAWLLLSYSKFVDFLIETEIEMGRVIWPTRKSVIGSSVVVIVTVVVMSAVLYGVDYLLVALLKMVGIY